MEARSKRVQYLIAFSVSLATVSVGCYTSWPAPVMPKLRSNTTGIQITDYEMSWMVASSSPGFLCGSLATRFISDRLGRRTTLLGSALPAAIGTTIVAAGCTAWLLFIVRFLWGFGTGMIITVVTLYIAEIANKEIRGSLSLISRFMFNFGNLLIMCIGPSVSYSTLNCMLFALPVVYFATCWWIPESPYYLLKEGKVDDAKHSLMVIRACDDEKLLEGELSQMQCDVKNEMRSSSTAKELFSGKKYRRAVIIAAGLKLTQNLSGQLIIQQYLGLIIEESDTTLSLRLVFIIFGVVRFVVGVVSSFLADRLGRRPLLIYSYLGTAISLIIVGFYFFLLDVIRIDHSTMKPYSIIPFVGIITSNLIATLGFYSIIAVVPSEIFPLNVRAIAMTSINIFGAILTFILATGYQIIKDCTGLCGVFWFFGTGSTLGFIFSLLFIPETKGKSLRDIQILLQGDLYQTEEVLMKLNEINCDIVINSDKSVTSCGKNHGIVPVSIYANEPQPNDPIQQA